MIVIVDSYSETNRSAYIQIYGLFPGAICCAVGQTFTGDGRKLYQAKFYLLRYGSPVGELTARLYAHTGVWGTSGKPTGDALASSSAVAAEGISDVAYELITFTFDATYTLTNGTHYCIDIEVSSGTWDGSNNVAVGTDTNSPTHSGNTFRYVSDYWKYYGVQDTCFYVYGIVGRSFGYIIG